MTILADSQIAELCTPPNFVITTNVPNSDTSGAYYYPQPVKSFSYLTEKEIQLAVAKSLYSHNQNIEKRDAVGIVDYRLLLPDELAQFKPMISPYVNGQVRKQRRAPTASELVIWENARKGGPIPDNFVCDSLDSGLEIDEKIISYGTSSYGYDVRLADEFKIFTNINNTIIDPLDFDQKCLHDHKGPYCIIPPNSYILGKTIEYFDIPQDVMVVCVGKSTYARLGAIVNVTPIEPGFKGNIVIEISNATSLPLKVYANMGISQFLFFKGSVPCKISYADRGGKYQGQTSVQVALT